MKPVADIAVVALQEIAGSVAVSAAPYPGTLCFTI
jgi:hypothetical protein